MAKDRHIHFVSVIWYAGPSKPEERGGINPPTPHPNFGKNTSKTFSSKGLGLLLPPGFSDFPTALRYACNNFNHMYYEYKWPNCEHAKKGNGGKKRLVEPKSLYLYKSCSELSLLILKTCAIMLAHSYYQKNGS